MPSSDSHDGQVQGATQLPSASSSAAGKPYLSQPDLFQPGDIVGGSYQIISQLGRGAMGLVFKAKHVTMDVEYALKVLTTEQLNANAVMRFQNEAQAIAKLNHQNIIAIYNFGLHDGRLPFYVMDLLYGDNLLDKLDAHGPMPVEVALPIFIEVCAGLSYAHRKGILHRDVKPANFVMLDTPDVRGAHVKVVDFGLVKFAEELKPDIQKLTAIGEVCGSPSYMSPEQSSSQKIDPRSDIYSLGCSLFQALTGKVPFMGRNASETMIMHHETAAPTLASKGGGKVYSEDLERLIAKMLAKAPMDRYQNMDSVAQDLSNIMHGKPLGTPQIMPSDMSTTGASTVPDRSEQPSAPGTVGRSQRTNVERVRADLESFRQTNIDAGSDSDPNLAALGDQPGGVAKLAKPLGIALVSLVIASGIVFGIWQSLHPVKKPATAQSTAAVSAVVPPKAVDTDHLVAADDSKSSSLANSALPSLDIVGLSDPEASAPIEIKKSGYFSKQVVKDGKGGIEFDFPVLEKNQNLAYLATSPSHSRRVDGKMFYPTGTALYLVPLPETLKASGFYEKFRPGEIKGIFLYPRLATDELFNCAAKVPGVIDLTIDDCLMLTDKIIPALNSFHLTTLRANGLAIDGAHLAKAHCWKDLRTLEVSKCQNVSPILKQLAGSKMLESLNVSNTKLVAGDWQIIGRLPSLKRLSIADNKMTAEDLHALSKLSNLTELNASNVRFGEVSPVEELRHFSALKCLELTRGYVKKQDLLLLRRSLPGLRISLIDSMNKGQFLLDGDGD
jgi:serine/threonine protein kinase